MQYFNPTMFIFALFPLLALGSPTLNARHSSLQKAQQAWRHDTGVVSAFLSEANMYSGQDLANLASRALAAELDELDHKDVLDAAFLSIANPDPNVATANQTLVGQGAFQFVVDGLNDLATNGASYNPDQVAFRINLITFDRCNFVLPAIDVYFQAVTDSDQATSPEFAIRPNNC